MTEDQRQGLVALMRRIPARADAIYQLARQLASDAETLLHQAAELDTLTIALERMTEPVVEEGRGRYCAPVGTEEERATGKVWPGAWVDATGYCRWYFPDGKNGAWHTGADLNLNSPRFDADAHAPVYAISDGEVYAVRQLAGWDWVICIRHGECLSRYAHGEDLQVREGETVTGGQLIARIGNAGGRFPYHLHFDVARRGARMENYPGDWPGVEKGRVERDYYDPAAFLRGRV